MEFKALRNLFRTTLLSGINVGFRGIALILVNKILTAYVGPSAYAIVGDFQNIYTVLTNLSSGSCAAGVTKYTSEYDEHLTKQQRVWKASFTITLVCSFVLACLTYIAPYFLGNLSYGSDETFAKSMKLLSFCLFPTALNIILLAILNGKKEIVSFTIANIAASFFFLLLSYLWIPGRGIFGAIDALFLHQVCALPITIFLIICRSSWSLRSLFAFGRIKEFRRLGKFTSMAIVTAILFPVSQYVTRLYMGETFGLDAAGIWEATNRFSAIYLLIFISPLTVYYLPRFSEIKNNLELRSEILLGYAIIIPASLIVAAFVFFNREFIIRLLFNESYMEMTNHLPWQAVGDVLKIGSWLLGFLLIARGMQKIYIMTEIIFSVLSVVLVIAVTQIAGSVGAQIAYTLNYAIYWVFLFFVFRPVLSSRSVS